MAHGPVYTATCRCSRLSCCWVQGIGCAGLSAAYATIACAIYQECEENEAETYA